MAERAASENPAPPPTGVLDGAAAAEQDRSGSPAERITDPELLAAAGAIAPDHRPTALAVATVDLCDTAMHPVRVQLNEIAIAQGTVASAVGDCRTAAAALTERLDRVDRVFAELPTYTAKVHQLAKTMATVRETSAKIHMTMEKVGSDVRLHAQTSGNVAIPAPLMALPNPEGKKS